MSHIFTHFSESFAQLANNGTTNPPFLMGLRGPMSLRQRTTPYGASRGAFDSGSIAFNVSGSVITGGPSLPDVSGLIDETFMFNLSGSITSSAGIFEYNPTTQNINLSGTLAFGIFSTGSVSSFIIADHPQATIYQIDTNDREMTITLPSASLWPDRLLIFKDWTLTADNFSYFLSASSGERIRFAGGNEVGQHETTRPFGGACRVLKASGSNWYFIGGFN